MEKIKPKKYVLIPLLVVSMLFPMLSQVQAAKEYIDFKSVKIQDAGRLSSRWGLGAHHMYNASSFSIDPNGLCKASDIKKNAYCFCMQPNNTGPWRYAGGGKTFTVSHQYGPYNELADSWDELYDIVDNKKVESDVQKKFKGKSTAGNVEYNRMALIARWISYYGPGGPGFKKGYKNPDTNYQYAAGNTLSLYSGGGKARNYDAAHVLASIWRADYVAGTTDIPSWDDTVTSVAKGSHSYMNVSTFKTDAKFIYDYYKAKFYDAGKIDVDYLYDSVPKNYCAGYFVCSGDNQDFLTGFMPDVDTVSLDVLKQSQSIRIPFKELEDGQEDSDGFDKEAYEKAIQEIMDFLSENELYSLNGTQIKIKGPGPKTKDGDTKTISVKADEGLIGWSSDDGEMDPSGGKYTVQEVKASKGYRLNNKVIEKTVTKDDKVVNMYNEPITIPLGVKINIKGSGLKSNDSLPSTAEPQNFVAKFKVEYWDRVDKVNPQTLKDKFGDDIGKAKATFTITTNKDGSATFDNEHIKFSDNASKKYMERFTQGEGLPLGYYRITEIEPPKGYILNPEPAAFIFDDSSEYDKVNRPVYYYVYNNGLKMWDSAVTLGGCDELKRSSCNAVFEQEPNIYIQTLYYIGIIAEKRENDTYSKTPQGDVQKFEKIKFEIVNNGPEINTMFDESGQKLPNADSGQVRSVAHGAVIYRGETDENGLFKTNGQVLPVASLADGGTEYILRETGSIEGYKLNSAWALSFTRYQEEYDDKKPGEIIDLRKNTDRVQTASSGAVENAVWRGGIELQKWDYYLDKSEAINGKDHDAGYGSRHDGTDLNNIKFTIINRSLHEVVVPKDIDVSIIGSTAPSDIDYSVKPGKYADPRLKTVAPGEVVGTITTSWDAAEKAYVAKTQKDALPYGTYEIQETRTNKYYQLTDTVVRTVQVREDGTVYKATKEGNPLVWKDKPYRQNVIIKKVMEGGSESGAYVPFKITSKTTGEYHYFVTDSNGAYDSSNLPHDRNTNGYDKYIDDCLAAGNEISSDELKKMRLSEDGVDVITPGLWFGLGEDGTEQKVDNDLASLPYGTYELEEIECSGNKGKAMIKKTFSVAGDENKIMLNSEKAINLGTISNKTIEIGTTAKSKATGTHEAPLTEKAVIIDTVSYKGLIEGKTYTIKGILMKKDAGTGSPLLDKAGKQIAAEKEFKAAAGGFGSVELTYEFDSSLLSGVTVVVFEDLYEKGIKVASHTEIEDKDQTIWFPEIKTTATDKNSGLHILTRGNKATVIDEVEYKSLTPGDQYVLEGTLMKITGSGENIETEPMRDDTGKEIIQTKTFTPKESSGIVKMEFVFPANEIEGAKTVVFEKLRKTGNIVAAHEDPADEKQTIYIAGVKTTATDKNSGLHLLTRSKNAVVVDEVEYRGLIPGKKYLLEGTLMKVTGSGKNIKTEPMKDDNGKKITQTKEFTPEASDGTVKMEFTFAAKKIEGAKTVVFEKLTLEGKPVAAHEDPEDEKQTIRIAKIKTKANVGDKNVVKDVVSYDNLVPGKKYTLTGWLVDKKTGKMVSGTKTVMTFKPSKSSGSVTMTIDAGKAKGTFVVFEECHYNNNLVGEHKDINDKHQTVRVKGRGTIVVKNNDNDGSFGTVGTGDSLKLWMVLLLISSAGVMAGALRRKKERVL